MTRASRLRNRTMGTALVGALAFVVSLPAHAELLPSDDASDLARKSAGVDQQRTAAQDDLDDTSRELVAAYTALVDADKQLPAARARLAAARTAEAKARATDAGLSKKLLAARVAQADAEQKYGAAAARLDAADAEVGRLASDLYEGSQGTELEALVTAEDPQAAADQLSMLDTVGAIQADTVLDLGAQRAVSAAQRAHLEAVRAEADRLKKASADAVAAATTATAAAADAERAVVDLVAKRTAAAKAVEQRKAAELARLAALDAESAKLKAVLAARAAAAAAAAQAALATGVPADAKGVLMKPVNAPMTSPFGPRFHPILHIQRMHTGQDFGAPCGAPVVAAADGTVVSAGVAGGYGNRVLVDHGLQKGVGLASAYNHLQTIAAKPGPIKRGQLVGLVGTTGLSTGCHLHFEVLVNGVYSNPTAWF